MAGPALKAVTKATRDLQQGFVNCDIIILIVPGPLHPAYKPHQKPGGTSTCDVERARSILRIASETWADGDTVVPGRGRTN
jgi:hypothetical protein